MKIHPGKSRSPRWWFRLRSVPLLAALLLLYGCDIDDELEECHYNARVDFYYSVNSQANVLPVYMQQVTDYLYDADRRLIEIIHRDRRSQLSYQGFVLPPGKYSLVSWGNRSPASMVQPAVLNQSMLDEMRLYLNNPYGSEVRTGQPEASGSPRTPGTPKVPELPDPPEPIHRNGDKLYYGHCSFEVQPSGISRARMDMAHSHCRLGIQVKWKRGAPSDELTYRMELSGLAGSYGFNPQWEIPNPYLPPGYAPGFYAIPQRGPERITQRVDTEMGITRSLRGEFITLRLSNDDHPCFRLYGDGKPVMKEIDLHRYFSMMQIDLDRNLRQEFDLVMEVQPDGTVIVAAAKVSDWQQGEDIGSGF